MRRTLVTVAMLSALGCSERTQLDLFAPLPDADRPVTAPVRDAAPRDVELDPNLELDLDVDPDLDAGVGLALPSNPPPALLLDAQPPAPPGASGFSESKLILRYDFSGRGTEVVDRVGTHSARALGGATLDGSGALALDGVDDYVALPERTFGMLESMTVVTWLIVREGVCSQPVFDFGGQDESSVSEDAAIDMPTALSILLSTCLGKNDAGTSVPSSSNGSALVLIPHNRTIQLALSFDAARSLKTVYYNGERVAQSPALYALSELGSSAWLGRLKRKREFFARASYDEFRVYDGALSAREIADLHRFGPDAP